MTELLQRSPYHFDEPLAAATCAHFLRTFRACPDNPAVPLDEWRLSLWSAALPAGAQLHAAAAYSRWLELRFRYLALTTQIVALLQLLRTDGYRLALITNGPSAAQWEKVRRLGCAPLFDVVLVSGDMVCEKPDARIFAEACRQLGVASAECVMVGDKLETDIQGGIEANLGGTIWTPLSRREEETLSGRIRPTHILHNVLEMRQFLPPLPHSSCSSSSSSSRQTQQQLPKTTTDASLLRRRGCGNGNTAAASAAATAAKFGGQQLQHLRVASLPDLDSGNSNSSDGS